MGIKEREKKKNKIKAGSKAAKFRDTHTIRIGRAFININTENVIQKKNGSQMWINLIIFWLNPELHLSADLFFFFLKPIFFT